MASGGLVVLWGVLIVRASLTIGEENMELLTAALVGAIIFLAGYSTGKRAAVQEATK